MLAQLVTFLDRGLLSLLAESIKHDLHLSDMQMSLVMGFAFACFYLLLGFPIARIIDYKSRRFIIGVGIAIWSFTTALCGLASSFAQLFFCRAGAGVGEACSSPSALSMLSDLFPREKLARALAVFQFGAYFGSGVSLIVGGAVATMFLRMPPRTLPLIGTLHGWQLTFLAVGLPGLLVSGLMATVGEPKRRGRLIRSGAAADAAHNPVPIKEVIGFVRANARALAPMLSGVGCSILLTTGLGAWAAVFYIRRFHWSPAKYGLIQGVVSLTVLPVGSYMGGLLAEYFANKGYDDANVRVVLMARIFAIPAAVLFPLMPTATLAMSFSVLNGFIGAWGIPAMNAAFQVITPNEMRGQVTMLLMFVLTLGTGVGPTVVAVFTQYLFRSEAMLGYSISLAALIVAPLGVLAWLMALKPYRRAVSQAKAWS
jgi:MFS family permease